MSDDGTIVALDLGGTHVSAGRIDLASAAVEDFVRLPLPRDADRTGLLSRISRAAAEVAGDGFDRVAVAAPGPFDYRNGVCLLADKLVPLFGVDLRHELSDALQAAPSSIVFVNDADAFLLGEWWVGAAVGHRRAVGVTLGTGLGSAFLDEGLVVDTGPLVPPKGSLHLVDYRGRPAEATISGEALIERYGASALDAREIATLARGGDERARRVFSELAAALGDVIAPWLVSFDATCLVVGGSIARAWDLLRAELQETLAALDGLETIAPAARIDEAPLLGAALHAAQRGGPGAPEGFAR